MDSIDYILVEYYMNERLREFEKESKLEIFGLGARRVLWEAALEKYAELIVKECIGIVHGSDMPVKDIKEHFGIE